MGIRLRLFSLTTTLPLQSIAFYTPSLSTTSFNFLIILSLLDHTVLPSNLRQDLITAKVSSGIPKQSGWPIMMS